MPDPIHLTVQGDEAIQITPEEIRIIKAISPTVTTEQTTGGAVITITDLDGPHTVTLSNGADGRGIANAVLNADYTLTITYTDGTSYTTPNIRGAQGRGIVSIVKTSTSGLEDTYTINYTDGTTATFIVTNGADGANGVSPTVLIQTITGGHRITITDAAHPQGQSIDVMDGQDGNDGRGIVSVEKAGTIGLLDTYTITYTSGSPTIFTVTNGAPGTPGTNAYVHIRYAAQQPTQDSDMSTTPGPWMGVYSGSSATAPTHYTDYAWNDVQGPAGASGEIVTVTVSGSTPSIPAEHNHLYQCGEVSTLSITPPQSGIFAVRFTSGSTATVLTATGITWPPLFNPATLAANTRYEINVLDGDALVASWEVSTS